MDDAATLQTRLTAVQTAMDAILVRGQRYRIGEIEFSAANLKELMEMESRLKRQLNAAANGGYRNNRTVGVFE